MHGFLPPFAQLDKTVRANADLLSDSLFVFLKVTIRIIISSRISSVVIVL